MTILTSPLEDTVPSTKVPTRVDQHTSEDIPPDAPDLVLNKTSKPETENTDNEQPKSRSKPLFREEQHGVWTLYFPIPDVWRPPILSLSFQWNKSTIANTLLVWWQFVSEVFSLGPLAVTVYFVAWATSGVFTSAKLNSESKLLGLAERVLAGRTQRVDAVPQLKQVTIEFLVVRVLAWATRALIEKSSSIVKQRVSLHFEKRLLSVQSRLELGTSRNPEIKSRIKRVSGYTSKAWRAFSNFSDIIYAITEVVALGSILKNQLLSPENSALFGLWSLGYPIIMELRGLKKDSAFYTKLTNQSWLRMQAFCQIGTKSRYKKEVLSYGLEDYINNQYTQAFSKLGDLSTESPSQPSDIWFDFEHIEELLEAFPLLFYTWSAVHDPSIFSLASMIKTQQTSSAVRGAIWRLVIELKDISELINDISALYEVLSLKPGIEDGYISYPDKAHAEQKGMSIEFKDVSFGYPSAPNKVLKSLSFKIEPGQLCVIVGENGCGKSTTINLINRLYDCDSGNIHIDNRPIRDYKVSTLRAAANIMYQSYNHFPLTIKENLLMGYTGATNPQIDIERAAKLGGAYDFIQKLPLKFETNLESVAEGWASTGCGEEDRKKFKCLKDEDNVELSGGQWQRLAISRSFMKNTANARLLCYDEPSASLDPKAEAVMFERLRKLRGEKTMIFVTHRFGHLTKHADLIIYIGDGSVVEQGTHKSLLAQGGEYAKMYKIQSEAFNDVSDFLSVVDVEELD